jgi:hypothetical protein
MRKRGVWLLALASACAKPTEITLHVVDEAGGGIAIAVGQPGDNLNVAGASTEENDGTLVIVPRDDKHARVEIKAVGGTGSLVHCLDDPAPTDAGCIVARRILSYIPHENLDLPVRLHEDCVNVPCDPSTTCLHGQCVSAEVASTCLDLDSCRDAGASDAAPTDANADASPDGGETVVQSTSTVVAIAVLNGTLFYAVVSPGRIGQRSSDGGASFLDLPDGSIPQAIAVDERGVYWSDHASSKQAWLTTFAGTSTGGQATGDAFALAVRGHRLYESGPNEYGWEDFADSGAITGGFFNAAVGGALGLAQSDAGVFVNHRGGIEWELTPPSPSVGGGNLHTDPGADALAASSTMLYWTRPDAGDVRTAPVKASGATTILVTAGGTPAAIVADDRDVYWLNRDNGGAIVRYSLLQRQAQIVAYGDQTGAPQPFYQALALDDTYVYWISFAEKKVFRLHR